VTTEPLCELAGAYALDALDADEARAFEAHLVGCPRCPDELRRHREVAAALAVAVPPVSPPPELRERLLARVRAERRDVVPLRPKRTWAVLAWAAVVAGLLVAGVQTVRLDRLVRRVAALADSVARREARVAELERQRGAVLDASIAMYRLTATADTVRRPSGPAGAQVFWSRERHTWLLHAFNLPSLPPGRVYQLWFVTGDVKLSAGVLEPDPEGHAILVVEVPPAARAATLAAVSVEPAGGSTQPTGPIVMAGSVAGAE
jgi:anti-sigma-K factor RskA